MVKRGCHPPQAPGNTQATSSAKSLTDPRFHTAFVVVDRASLLDQRALAAPRPISDNRSGDTAPAHNPLPSRLIQWALISHRADTDEPPLPAALVNRGHRLRLRRKGQHRAEARLFLLRGGAGPPLGRQAAHPRRGPANCHQRGKATGAFEKALNRGETWGKVE